MQVPFTFEESEVALIHLADDEWGNDVMRRVAREFFEANPSCNFVEVYEHAGWFLGFRRDDSVFCTANDMARPDPGVKAGRLAWEIRRTPCWMYPEGINRQLGQRAQLRVFEAVA